MKCNIKKEIISTLLLLLLLCSCINDNGFYPQTKMESLKEGLLINDYKFEDKIILMNDGKFKMIEAWTTYKFKDRFKKDVLTNNFAFRFRMVNLKTLDTTPYLGSLAFVKNDTLGSKFGGIGIVDSEFTIFYDKSFKNKLDTLKLEFVNSNDVPVSFNFYKK